MTSEKIQPYLTSEDGELFDLRISHGSVSFDVWELEEDEIYQFVNDILSMLKLLKSSGGDSLRERNERIQSGNWIA